MFDVPFGQFLPDAPDYKNPGLVLADNVYAMADAYKPIRSQIPTGAQITGEVRGAWRANLAGSESLLIVGTATDLWVWRDGVFTASSLGLTIPADEYWQFDQHLDAIYATTLTGGVFRLADVATDDTFAVCPGLPPKAATVDTVGDFLMLGDLEDIDATSQPFRVRWSGFNNPAADWVTDIGRQSGYVDFPTRYGRVTGIFGNGFDLVFQRRGVSRIWYTGGATVFDKRTIEEDRGCPAPASIVRVGGFLYFLSDDGFCRTDGASVEIVSSDRVWDWFYENVSAERMPLTQGAVDWANRSIVWSFQQDGRGFTRQIIFNFGLDRWTTASFEVDWLIEGSTGALSVDEDDGAVMDDDELEADAPSFDDPRFLAQGRSLMAMGGVDLCTFLGGALRATFQTGDFQVEPGKKSLIRGVTPLAEMETAAGLVEIAGRDRIGAAQTFTPPAAQNALEFCPVMSDARYHSVRLAIPANVEWNKASGIQLDVISTGVA